MKTNAMMAAVIVAVVLSVIFQIEAADEIPVRVLGKSSGRYYKIRDREYALNSEGKLPDISAKGVLRIVERAYQEQKRGKKGDDKVIQGIWESLHKIHSGEAYDEILFLCLKYRLNNIYAYLKPTKKNVSGNMYRRMVFLGDVLFVTAKAEERRITMVDGRVRWLTVASLRVNIMEKDSAIIYKTGGSPRAHWKVIYPAYEKMASNEFADVKKRACDTFVSKVEALITYYLDHCDNPHSRLDKLLLELPKPILTLPKGSDKKADCDQDAVNMLAGRVLEVCLKHCKAEQMRKSLALFGRKMGLKFSVPKSTGSAGDKPF